MMKNNTSISLIVIGLIILLSVSCLTANDVYEPTGTEQIYGTWTNSSYDTGKAAKTGWFPGKIIFLPDGLFEVFPASGDKVGHPHKYTILEKWKDSEDSVWYKIRTDWGDETYGEIILYDLYKVSNSGNTLEYMSSPDEFATEIDSENPNYHIYMRN